jgi:hypothetical protein
MEPERPWSLEGDVRLIQTDVRGLQTDVAGLRADVRHVQADLSEVKVDVRRLDDRFFQLMLLQIGTLLAALASVATAVVTAIAVY